MFLFNVSFCIDYLLAVVIGKKLSVGVGVCWERREKETILLSLSELFGIFVPGSVSLHWQGIWEPLIFKVHSILMLFILAFHLYWPILVFFFSSLSIWHHSWVLQMCSDSSISEKSSKHFIALRLLSYLPLYLQFNFLDALCSVFLPSSLGFHFYSFVVVFNKDVRPFILRSILWPLTHPCSLLSPLTSDGGRK